MNPDFATTRHFQWRMIAPVMLAAIVAIVLSRIPLPGFNFAAMDAQPGRSRSEMAQFSIFALGAIPLFTVLAYAEIVKLLVPSLARWRSASLRNAGLMNAVIVVVVVVMTVVEAFGVLKGMVGAVEQSAIVIFAGIASFVGSSLIVIWLCSLIRLPGLENGIWVFFAISFLNELSSTFIWNVEQIRFGSVPGVALLTLVLCVLAAIAIAVTMYFLLHRTGCGRETGQQISLSVLLWPPFLAGFVAYQVVALIPIPALQSYPDMWSVETAQLLVAIVLIPLFVYAYSRHVLPSQPDAAQRIAVSRVLVAVAAAQIVLCVGQGLLLMLLPLTTVLVGPMLIVCVVVILSVMSQLRAGPGLRP